MLHVRHFLINSLSCCGASETAALAPVCSVASTTHKRFSPDVVQIEMVQ